MEELVAGSLAGAAGKLFEYPFDTAKVRLQTQSLHAPKHAGALECMRETWREGGLRAMYRGISAPMLASAVETAVLFAVFDRARESLKKRIPNPTAQAVLAGAISGLAASTLLTPIEYVKCRVQVTTGAPKAQITQLILQTLKQHGPLRFWRGQLGTAIRECGGSAAWFGMFYALNTSVGPLLAGASAGIAYNLSTFPADSVKSRMQTDNRHLTFFQVAKEVFRGAGVRGFYRGCAVTCLRAAPSNAIIFGVHDLLTKVWGSHR